MKEETAKCLAKLADILTVLGFIPILAGIIYWMVTKMNWTLFLEIWLAVIFIISLGYSISYRLTKLKEKFKGKYEQDLSNIKNDLKQLKIWRQETISHTGYLDAIKEDEIKRDLQWYTDTAIKSHLSEKHKET